jgi:hypothetical protein
VASRDPGQLPPAGHSGAVSPVGQVGIRGRHGGRGERDLHLPGALAGHPDHPVAAVLAEAGDAGGAGLGDARGIVQQQPHHGRGAQRLGAGVGATSARAWSRSRPIGCPRRPRRTPILDLPGDPAGSAKGFKAADFGCGPALPNRLSQAPGHQPTNARFCRIEGVACARTYAQLCITFHDSARAPTSQRQLLRKVLIWPDRARSPI